MIPKLGITKTKNYLINKFVKKNSVFWNTNIASGTSLNNVHVKERVSFAKNASISNSKIGKYTSIGRNTKITHTEIGSFCSISWDITINAIEHPYDRLTMHAFPYLPSYGFVEQRESFYKKVIIKNDVWIGANVVIMPGITIGNGAIIGAGAVVTKNVQDYEIVAGVPAKHIKFRFEQDIINKLLKLKWWEKDISKIKQNINLFKKQISDEVIETFLSV